MAQEDLVRELGAAPEHVARAVDTLIARGFLAESGRLRTQLIPARDLESATVGDLWRAIRAGATELQPQPGLGREIVELLDDAERGFIESKGRTSLRDWLKKPSN